MVLLGHLGEIRGGKIEIQGDLGANLKKADEFEAWIVRIVDEYIEKNNIDAPPERLPALHDGYQQPEIRELDFQSAGISAVIWATGYRFDFSWVKLPVFDSYGFPIQSRGVTGEPGLYFVGLPWLVNQKSGLLMGVGDDAAYIAAHLASKRAKPILCMKRCIRELNLGCGLLAGKYCFAGVPAEVPGVTAPPAPPAAG